MLLRFPNLSVPPAVRRRRNDELRQLVQGTLAGDEDAGRTLVASLTPHLLRNVRRVLGPSHPDVEDTTQDALVSVVRALPSYRGDSTVLQFACQIATRTAIDVWRRRSYRDRRSAELARTIESQSPNQTPEQRALSIHCANALQHLVATLPVQQAEVVALHFIQGLTVKEVAELTESPLETVRSRLRLGLTALRRTALDDPQYHELFEEPAR